MKRRESVAPPVPQFKFKVHPESRAWLYFEVEIYRSQEDLARARKLYFPRKRPVPVWAFTDIACASGNKMGVMCFSRDSVNAMNVSHECFHATMAWVCSSRLKAKRGGGVRLFDLISWGSSFHERVAEGHGMMVDRFWKQWELTKLEKTG